MIDTNNRDLSAAIKGTADAMIESAKRESKREREAAAIKEAERRKNQAAAELPMSEIAKGFMATAVSLSRSAK
ncbi:hypothetical protein [Paracoccus sanguinis]|uniref:hypothetical protein n=1 Tax=Paracoccus sanguinis TaxID=1545044 RepID=UPI0012E02387|nr:hypothetical protein [Paracoccus sanguinis]